MRSGNVGAHHPSICPQTHANKINGVQIQACDSAHTRSVEKRIILSTPLLTTNNCNK